MTEEEIKAIETHTEIHAKAEPRAIKITEILRKAVRELRENKHLEEEMEIMTDFCGACKKKHEGEIETLKHNKKTVAHLSSCISDIQKKKIADLEQKLEQTEKDLADYQFNYPTIKELEKENAELKAQIEKIKCCENCAYRTVDLLTFKPFCDKIKLGIENPLTCKCDKWKLVN